MGHFWYKLRLSHPWRYKAPVLLACVYMVFIKKQTSLSEMAPWLGLSLVTIVGIAGIGYLINDFSDRQSDGKAGKPNFFIDTSQLKVALSITVLTCCAIGPWYFFPMDRLSWVLFTGELVCFIIYSLPPFRLKKNIWVAPILDALYAHVLPVILATHTFLLITHAEFSFLHMAALVSWQLTLGIRLLINHLVEDRPHDLLNYHTLATQYSAHRIRRFLWYTMLIELLLFTSVLFFASNLFISISTGLVLLAFTLKQKSRYSFVENVPDSFYRKLLGGGLTVVLIFTHGSAYVLLLMIHMILFPVGQSHELRKVLSKLYQIGSVIVNYGIYYFRRFVLRQSEKQARREYYEQDLINKTNQMKSDQLGSITIANLNLNKYSETYIHEYKNQLPYGVDFLYGGYPPVFDEFGQPLIKSKSSINSKRQLQDAIVQRLNKTRSRLVLAHFGPMAVSMLPICRAAGVPMAAYFHAYDVHHKDQLEAHLAGYLDVFNHAHLLIGSSQEVIKKLNEMGAPVQKLKYLPAYVDLTRFTYVDHSSNQPNLLSVGRFADTKAPHLTILAFKQVLEEVPNARLTMIGDGELLEASISLTKALQIDHRVSFPGARSPMEIYEEMKNSRVFLQHSITTPLNHDKEGTPVAIMEAMACGLPVISTAHAGIAELISHEQNGLLIPELEIAQMAEQTIRCLKSVELSKKLGKNASESIRSNPLITDHMRIITEMINHFGLKQG